MSDQIHAPAALPLGNEDRLFKKLGGHRSLLDSGEKSLSMYVCMQVVAPGLFGVSVMTQVVGHPSLTA